MPVECHMAIQTEVASDFYPHTKNGWIWEEKILYIKKFHQGKTNENWLAVWIWILIFFSINSQSFECISNFFFLFYFITRWVSVAHIVWQKKKFCFKSLPAIKTCFLLGLFPTLRPPPLPSPFVCFIGAFATFLNLWHAVVKYFFMSWLCVVIVLNCWVTNV